MQIRSPRKMPKLGLVPKPRRPNSGHFVAAQALIAFFAVFLPYLTLELPTLKTIRL